MDISSVALQGLHGAEAGFDRTAARFSRVETLSQESPVDRVDLSTEAVNLLAAKSEYEVNVKSLQAGDEMTKSLLAAWREGTAGRH